MECTPADTPAPRRAFTGARLSGERERSAVLVTAAAGATPGRDNSIDDEPWALTCTVGPKNWAYARQSDLATEPESNVPAE